MTTTETKKAWQMTVEEYVTFAVADATATGMLERNLCYVPAAAKQEHAAAVRAAGKAAMPVPDAVKAEYPKVKFKKPEVWGDDEGDNRTEM